MQTSPGIIAHTTAVVEHPETIAERLVRFAQVVGRDRVIAGITPEVRIRKPV
jgi:5-methyltetrahydropteroyltriglutamate--homocysteine methyltransferase